MSMAGVGMAKAGRKRRVPSLPAWALEPVIDPRLEDDRGITPERRQQAAKGFVWGRDERGQKTVQTMRDSPLEAAHDRGALNDRQYNAAMKYKTHWFQGGLAGAMQSIDPNRVFASGGFHAHLARTENQLFHRDQYRSAVEIIGIIPAAVLDTIACYEKNLSDVGREMGWRSKPKGIKSAEEILRDALDKLCRHWGI